MKAKGWRSNVEPSKLIVAYCTTCNVGDSLAAVWSRDEEARVPSIDLDIRVSATQRDNTLAADIPVAWCCMHAGP